MRAAVTIAGEGPPRPAGGRPKSRGRRAAGRGPWACGAEARGRAGSAACSGSSFLIGARRARRRRSSSVVAATGPFGDGRPAPRARDRDRRRVVATRRSAAGRSAACASSLDELVEAADRVESGDYSARVARAGARAAPDARSRPRASTRWPPGSRPMRRSAGRSWPTSATSCGRRWRSSRATSRRCSTASTRPTTAHLGAILEETRVLGRLVDDLRTARPLGARQPAAPSRADRPRPRRDRRGRGFRPAADAAGVDLAVEVARRRPAARRRSRPDPGGRRPTSSRTHCGTRRLAGQRRGRRAGIDDGDAGRSS